LLVIRIVIVLIMGRKPIKKARKTLSPKAKKWVRELFSKLQDKPLAKMTLDDIVLLTGKSRSTIYTYFTTKEEIYLAMVELILDELEHVLFPKLPKELTARRMFADAFMKIGEGINGISIHFLEEIQTHFPVIWEVIVSFNNRILDMFKEIYELGMRTGEFKSFRIDLLMAMDYYFITSIMTDEDRFQDPSFSLKDLVGQYLELRINGLKP